MRFLLKNLTKITFLFAVCAWLFMPAPGYSEFYKYKDENGVIRYTDDLSEVPKDQRPQLRIYDEPDDFLTPEEKAEKSETKGESEKSEEKPKSDRMAAYEKLRKEGEELNKELEALRKEREKLEAESARPSYKEKTEKLNERVKAYEKKRLEYNKKVKEFNRQAQ